MGSGVAGSMAAAVEGPPLASAPGNASFAHELHATCARKAGRVRGSRFRIAGVSLMP